jgi:hypothetical protein
MLSFTSGSSKHVSFLRGFPSNDCYEFLIIYKCDGPPLWSSGQSSCLQTRRSAFDSRRYHIFWVVVGLERDPLSLVSTTEELLGRNSSGSGLDKWEYGRRNPPLWPRSGKFGINLDDKRRSLGRYSSLGDSGQGVIVTQVWCMFPAHTTFLNFSTLVTANSLSTSYDAPEPGVKPKEHCWLSWRIREVAHNFHEQQIEYVSSSKSCLLPAAHGVMAPSSEWNAKLGSWNTISA